jgi:hypothetical protein
MWLRSKATTRPDNDEASRDQLGPGQLHGKLVELLIEAVLGGKHNLGYRVLGEEIARVSSARGRYLS